MKLNLGDKHWTEEDSSWELFQQRSSSRAGGGRRLDGRVPRPEKTTQHAMMIDAGSQGTRLHVYEFEARILSRRKHVDDAVKGQRLSFPTTDTRWTSRLHPGLDYFAYIMDDERMKQEVRGYLEPVMDFAMETLSEKKDDWHLYPIYLKATGGVRELPVPFRLRLMEVVRELFYDSTFNPFLFESAEQ
jgi:hypothetical protein